MEARKKGGFMEQEKKVKFVKLRNKKGQITSVLKMYKTSFGWVTIPRDDFSRIEGKNIKR